MDTTNDIYLEDLEAYGTALRDMAEEKEDITCLLPFTTRSVVMAATNLKNVPTLAEGFAIITSYWHALDELAPTTQARFAEILAQATRRADRLGITHWGPAFDTVACEAFISSRTSQAEEPSISLQHLRRSSLRAGFSTLHRIGLTSKDPTRGINLPTRSQLATRAATDDEIALLEMHALASRASRQPMILALAESSGMTAEIPFVTFEHLDDLDNPTTVEFSGTPWVKPRVATLSPFGQRVLRGRIKVLRRDNTLRMGESIVYAGSKKRGDVSPTASMCQSISEVFRRAGLHRERDLRPASVAFWAGRQAFETAKERKLEAAAQAMGLKSLDMTAQKIDYSWDQQ
jgi:site-specific recombinase XerD